MYLPLIGFSIFIVCIGANVVMTSRLIRALERHPETLDAIPGPHLIGWGLHRYAMCDDYRRLRDPAVEQRVRNYRRVVYLTMCVGLANLATILIAAFG
jgi:hypothetical protein